MHHRIDFALLSQFQQICQIQIKIEHFTTGLPLNRTKKCISKNVQPRSQGFLSFRYFYFDINEDVRNKKQKKAKGRGDEVEKCHHP